MSTPDTQMNQYLTTIAEAVHGRDMRAAIHDGLEKTYNDSYTWFNQSLSNANQALQKATEALNIAEPMGDDIQEVKDLAEDLDTKYDETNERVNNIIAHNNDTDGNSELIDLRTTYDGQVKTSAGSAVRSQISNLHSRINNLVREQSTGELEDCHVKPVYVPLYENQYPSSAFAAQTLQLSLPGSPAPSLTKYALIKITFKDSNLFGAGVRSVYMPMPGYNGDETTAYSSDGFATMTEDGTYGLDHYARRFEAVLSSNYTVLNIMFTDCKKIATDNPFAISNSDMTISDPSSTTSSDNEHLIPYAIFLIDYVLDGEIEVDKDTELIDIRNGEDGTNYQSAGAAVRGQIGQLKSALDVTTGTVLFNDTHSYAGGAENWSTIPLTESVTLAIRFPDNSTGVSLEVAANVSGWIVLDTISDDAWHIVTIPNGVSNKLVFTYRGTSAFTTSCLVIDVSEDNLTKTTIGLSNAVDDLATDVNDIQDALNYSAASYGNNGESDVPFIQNFLNFSATPCKRADKGGQITSLYVKSETAGTTEIYVGEVDQLYLFVPRQSFTITLSTGEQNIDVTSLGIYINEGEQVLIRFIGQVPFSSMTGEPQGDNSFYYAKKGGMQLQVYAAQKAAVFGFGYTVTSTIVSEQTGQIIENTSNIGVLQGSVSELQANANIISDRSGNKYRMIVQNGAISLLSMNFSHVLCVGNSYTTHPTTTDTEADYQNNLWWGHWSMAASDNATAWTTLLQNALRQKINTAKVTPVFGRRYETNYNVYNLSNANTFTYWDGSAWLSLMNNLSSFSDVDAIVFFLGANYSGTDWYTLYKAMVEQFLVWFPNVSLFCCSCSAYANAAKDGAIQQVANEELASYISMVGINGKSKIGSYVKGDDGELHQINNAAVAGHFGDYGEYLILDRVCNAMGYTNNSVLRNITINSITGVTLSVISTKTIAGAIISVFADVASGTSLSGITVTSGGNTITVTDHGETDYGRVFTFVMPEGDTTITAVSA